MSWLRTLAGHERDGTAAVLVTLLRVRGSAPREAGTKMVVSGDALDGTIGGGALEHACVAISRDLLERADAEPVLREFPLGPALGQCCGGHVSVLFEPVLPAAWTVAVFGAGHVGRALVGLLAALPCRVLWRDGRGGMFPHDLPVHVATSAGGIDTVPPRASVLVMTHDHQVDFELTEAALRRSDLAFVGLIGSDTKRARFVSRLRRGGLSDAAISQLVCPVGLPGAGGKLPAEIAIAVAAQLLQVRDAGATQKREAEPAMRETVRDMACAGCKAAAR